MEAKQHRFIVVRGIRYWNTHQIAFRIIYGYDRLEYYGPEDEEHQIINTRSEIPTKNLEEILACMGFHKIEQAKAE